MSAKKNYRSIERVFITCKERRGSHALYRLNLAAAVALIFFRFLKKVLESCPKFDVSIVIIYRSIYNNDVKWRRCV